MHVWQEGSTTEGKNRTRVVSKPTGPVLVEQTRTIMASEIDIHLAVPPDRAAAATRAMEACFSWLEEVDARLTRFQSESELCRLNAASGSWRAVSDMLFTVLEQSLAAAKASDGLFDPTLLSLLEALGYDRDYKAMAQRGARHDIQVAPVEWRVAHRSPLTGAWRRIQLDKRHRRVRLPLGARLDFGGIAKGWAADVALERFFAGFENVLVNLGGDMRVRGGRGDGEPWPVGIGSSSTLAQQPGYWQSSGTVVTLGHGGLATSGAADRWWYQAGQLRHHLLDPRTGQPARVWIATNNAPNANNANDANDASEDSNEPQHGAQDDMLIAAATAFAPTAAHAEVAAKVALLRRFPAALRLVEAAWETWKREHAAHGAASARIAPYGDAGVALLLTLETGEVVYSANMEEYLTMIGGGGDVWLS